MLSASEASVHNCHAERERSISEILRFAQNDREEGSAERHSVMLSASEASQILRFAQNDKARVSCGAPFCHAERERSVSEILRFAQKKTLKNLLTSLT
jgi:hypothetical protein